jgi:hypothetical protein
MQKCVFLPYTPFEIFARDQFNCKKNQNCPIVSQCKIPADMGDKSVKMGGSKERFKHTMFCKSYNVIGACYW